MTKAFWKAALIRALWTAAQAALGFLTLDGGAAIFTSGVGITDIDWIKILSVTALAAVYSLIKSIAVGLPEIMESGEKQEDGKHEQ